MKGMGGAMDLCASVKRIIVLMSLMDKYGDKKFKKTIDLPITAPKCVSMLITEQAVFEFTPNGVVLKEVAKGLSVDKIRSMTDVEFTADNVGLMEDNFSSYVGGGGDDEDLFSEHNVWFKAIWQFFSNLK